MSTLGTADRRFPRAGGVIVPAALRELCRASRVLAVDADTDSLSADERHRLARDVVRAVSRNAHRLRQEVLLAPLPAPEIMLGALVLDDRTRCALERLRPSLAHVNAWSIERYLRLPKFGAHCLVDLLAAREEAARGSPGERALASAASRPPMRGVRREPPFDARLADEISALLVRRAPFAGADAGALLVEAGLATRPLSLRELAAGYRSLNLPLPIRIARHGGVDVAVPAGTVGVATSVIATAVRFVADWGMATVESIGDRVRALRATSVAREIAARVVV
ncbi:MAG TPA: hypothetical protein VMU50_05905, partial [Polyangia bacterium]|nr:hypothetical protein [Polyangia bacterium]